MGISTSDFLWCEYSFSEWNPVQEACLSYLVSDKNLVVSASVASGKTALAEGAMAYEIKRTHPDGTAPRVIYTSPLRALGSEKLEVWKRHPTFGKMKITLLDGEHPATKEELNASNLIVATVESLCLRCRKPEPWIKTTRLLVLDEAHMLGDENRGHVAEEVLMTVSELNPKCRLMCLSGTLPNTKEIASWLHLLNGKSTPFINSTWRPTPLEKKVIPYSNWNEYFDLPQQIIQNNPDDKTIIFVHSKREGKTLKQQLAHTLHCEFYSANTPKSKREQILNYFRSQVSGLDVLIATSSLAQGVSL